jgi:hypothetical protein
MAAVDASSQPSGKRRPAARDDVAVPDLSGRGIAVRHARTPPGLPLHEEKSVVKVRRTLIAEPGIWMTVSTQTNISEAAARKLVYSFKRAKPSRRVPEATGKFDALHYRDGNRWLVAAVYQPPADTTQQPRSR